MFAVLFSFCFLWIITGLQVSDVAPTTCSHAAMCHLISRYAKAPSDMLASYLAFEEPLKEIEEQMKIEKQKKIAALKERASKPESEEGDLDGGEPTQEQAAPKQSMQEYSADNFILKKQFVTETEAEYKTFMGAAERIARSLARVLVHCI